MKLGDFTGIKGIPNQDIAMWETMGPIADRTKERLGASDLAVVEFRKLMVDAARADARQGHRHRPHHAAHPACGNPLVRGRCSEIDQLAYIHRCRQPRPARTRWPEGLRRLLQPSRQEDGAKQGGIDDSKDVRSGARTICGGRISAAGFLAAAQPAGAQDKLKLAVGQRGNWDTSVSEVGQRAGIFKKHGLELEIVYTQGAGETQQAAISGGVDIGVAAGIMGVLGAYSKGAPVRVIGAETTGAADLYWYVKADSPIKSLKDTDGKTLAYSTNGSSTHGIVTAFMKQYGLEREADRDRRASRHVDAGDVRPDRYRLGGAALRARPTRPEADPRSRQRQ